MLLPFLCPSDYDIEFYFVSPYNVFTGTDMPSNLKGDKNLIIKDENDFLGFIIQNSTDDFANQYELLQLSGLDHETYNYYVNLLKSKNYLQTDLANVYLTDLGKSSYAPNKIKIKKSFFKLSELSIKFVFKTAVEIGVAVLIGFLLYHFGWN